MSQNTQVDVFSDLIALQIGIIHPKIFKARMCDNPLSIDNALASMTVQEARVCKRKFRKLFRKSSKARFWTPVKKRRIVDAKIRRKAHQMIKDLDKCNDS